MSIPRPLLTLIILLAVAAFVVAVVVAQAGPAVQVAATNGDLHIGH